MVWTADMIGQSPDQWTQRDAELAHKDLLWGYCQRLPYIVQFRLDPRLAGRISVEEIADEIAQSLCRRAASHRCRTARALFLCLRSATMSMLERIEQEYLGRDHLTCEGATLRLTALPSASVRELAGWLWGPAAVKTEGGGFVFPRQQLAIQRAFNGLDRDHREILAMRHFEQLTREEIAAILDLTITSVCFRYVQALTRLKAALHRFEPPKPRNRWATPFMKAHFHAR
jgi:RNA polymerase sigma-70 factor (ECF subfamily)